MSLNHRPVQVWVDRDSNQSIIVELLELEEDCADHEAAERIFRDCAQVSAWVGLISRKYGALLWAIQGSFGITGPRLPVSFRSVILRW